LWSAYDRWSDAYTGRKSEQDSLTIHPEKELIVEPEDRSTDDDDDDEGIRKSGTIIINRLMPHGARTLLLTFNEDESSLEEGSG
jgi:hypothetical protein